jgi:hypothetical protein
VALAAYTTTLTPASIVVCVSGAVRTVALQASRRGTDQDGRHYTIVVSATDVAGNQGSAFAIVTVPRN